MSRGDMVKLLRQELGVPEGHCIGCDRPLPPTRRGPHQGGRNRSTLCGAHECLLTYYTLRRSKERELARLALEHHLRAAARSIGAANDNLERLEEGGSR